MRCIGDLELRRRRLSAGCSVLYITHDCINFDTKNGAASLLARCTSLLIAVRVAGHIPVQTEPASLPARLSIRPTATHRYNSLSDGLTIKMIVGLAAFPPVIMLNLQSNNLTGHETCFSSSLFLIRTRQH